MTTETYNGWRNRETWGVSLWLSNEVGDYHAMNYWLTDLIESDGFDYSKGAEVVENFVRYTVLAPDEGDSMFAEGVGGLAGDLLESSLQAVDWREIATAWMDDLKSEGVAA